MFLGNEILIKIGNSNDSLNVNKPIKAYVNSAGYDLYSDESFNILSWSRAAISTGIRMFIPNGYYGEICPRSGLAVRNGILAFNGTIDSGYLGIVYVLLFNLSDKEYFIKKGDRIAQIIFKKFENVSFSFDELTFNTDRGVKGLGSSGV